MELQDTITITLVKPIGEQGEILEITLTEPTLDQLDQLVANSSKFSQIKAMKSLIASISGVSVGDLGKMSVRDFKKCQRFFEGFLEEPQETSAN